MKYHDHNMSSIQKIIRVIIYPGVYFLHMARITSFCKVVCSYGFG